MESGLFSVPTCGKNSNKMLQCIFCTAQCMFQEHRWVTKNGTAPMSSEEQNCVCAITVTDEDVDNSVKIVPKLETLVCQLSIIIPVL